MKMWTLVATWPADFADSGLVSRLWPSGRQETSPVLTHPVGLDRAVGNIARCAE